MASRGSSPDRRPLRGHLYGITDLAACLVPAILSSSLPLPSASGCHPCVSSPTFTIIAHYARFPLDDSANSVEEVFWTDMGTISEDGSFTLDLPPQSMLEGRASSFHRNGGPVNVAITIQGGRSVPGARFRTNYILLDVARSKSLDIWASETSVSYEMRAGHVAAPFNQVDFPPRTNLTVGPPTYGLHLTGDNGKGKDMDLDVHFYGLSTPSLGGFLHCNTATLQEGSMSDPAQQELVKKVLKAVGFMDLVVEVGVMIAMARTLKRSGRVTEKEALEYLDKRASVTITFFRPCPSKYTWNVRRENDETKVVEVTAWVCFPSFWNPVSTSPQDDAEFELLMAGLAPTDAEV